MSTHRKAGRKAEERCRKRRCHCRRMRAPGQHCQLRKGEVLEEAEKE